MEITTSLNLKAEEETELAQILRCNNCDLPDKLRPYASAAIQEYVTMILGQQVFSRGSDMRAYRLFLMIQEVFGNKIPGEDHVSRLFQTTSTESRSLIRSITSKYQYKLQGALKQSIIQVIQTARQAEDGEDYTVTINCKTVVEALNRTLAEEDGGLQQVHKVRNTVSTYKISPASFVCLQQRYEDLKSGQI